MPSATVAVQKFGAGLLSHGGFGNGTAGARTSSRFSELDEGLLWVAALLLLIGLVMVYRSEERRVGKECA